MIDNGLLSNRSYRRLFLAQIISLAGTGVTTIALALLAWDLAGRHASEVLGTALALKMVVYVVIAPIMGAFARELPRRAWLVSMDLVRVGVVVSLPFVTAVWQIYVLIVLLNICSAGFTPVFQATIPDIVHDEVHYQKALSFAQVAYSLEQVLSPTFAAVLLVFMPYSALFNLDAATFLVSALLILGVAMPARAPADRSERVLDNLAFGLVAYLRTPRLRATWVMYFAVAVASAMVIVNTVVYVRDVLGRPEADVAWAITLSGIGSVLGAITVPYLANRWRARTIMLGGCLLLAVTLLAGGLSTGYFILLVLWCFVGVGLSLVQTPVGMLVRRSCRPEDGAAYFAANFSLSHLCWLFAYPLAGFTSSYMGMSSTFFIMGGIAMFASLFALRLYPDSDEHALEHTHDEIEHSHFHVHEDEHHATVGQHGHVAEAGNHRHPHRHAKITHTHPYVIDLHHPRWPEAGSSS